MNQVLAGGYQKTSDQTSDTNPDPSHLSDQKLYQLCQEYGQKSLKYRRKFAALLPEVYKRGIYRKKFQSIYHFAKVMCGMTEKNVKEILRIAEKLTDMPHLRAKLATEGWAKTRAIISIATRENDAQLAEVVSSSTKRVVEEFAKQYNSLPKEETGIQENLFVEPKNGDSEATRVAFGEKSGEGKSEDRGEFESDCGEQVESIDERLFEQDDRVRMDFKINKKTDFQKAKNEYFDRRSFGRSVGKS